MCRVPFAIAPVLTKRTDASQLPDSSQAPFTCSDTVLWIRPKPDVLSSDIGSRQQAGYIEITTDINIERQGNQKAQFQAHELYNFTWEQNQQK